MTSAGERSTPLEVVRGAHLRPDAHDRARTTPRVGYRGEQWLPLALPVSARRFRVEPGGIASTLAEAGGVLVDDMPDVEIVTRRPVLGNADVVVVSVEAPPYDGTLPAILRAAQRAMRSLRARVRAMRARGQLQRRGYTASVTTWDVTHRLPTDVLTAGARQERRALNEQLPERAFIVGHRGARPATVLEAVLESAASELGHEVRPRSGSVRAGFLLVDCGSSMLRIAVGPSRRQIVENARVVSLLESLEPPAEVTSRVPEILASGRTGLADWTLERRIAGVTVRPGELPEDLLPECIDFLVALHGTPGSASPAESLFEPADVVASACRPRDGAVVLRLAEALERRLERVARGFAHGDFFRGNLVVHADALAGVIDWDAGGPGRLPLVDLLHHRLHLDPMRDTEWGEAVMRRLVPWARGGGDEVSRRYLSRVDTESDEKTLEALVAAYWLERTAYQLRTHAVRRDQPRWLEANVDGVLESLAVVIGSGR